MDSNMVVGAVDVIALVVLMIGALAGFRRGLSAQIAGPLSLLLAILFALYAYAPIRQAIHTSGWVPASTQSLAGIAGVVLASLVGFMLLRWILSRGIRRLTENRGEHVGGALFGALRTALLILIVFLLMNVFPHPGLNRLFGEDSLIGRQVIRMTPAIRAEWEAWRQSQPTRSDHEAPAEADDPTGLDRIREGKQRRTEDWTQIGDR